MPKPETFDCPRCASAMRRNELRCPFCSAEQYPHVNLADAEEPELKARFEKEYIAAETAGLPVHDLLEALELSQVSLNVDVGFLYALLTDERKMYATYRDLTSAGARRPAAHDNDAQRAAVEALLFGGSGSHLVYANLTLDGQGPQSYGGVCLQLKEAAVKDRTALLEENSFFFVERHQLRPGMKVPLGYRSTWDRRAWLGVAKLATDLRAGMGGSDFARLVVWSDGNRANDRFIEAHLWWGFNRSAIEAACVQDRPKKAPDRILLKKAAQEARRLGIRWSEA